ncbi:MAG: hypothetical protein A3F31_00095 [Candidatus Levybacteria bacterium RIFCSPHIGHO2_12_FULL_38_12]|nr:MAG: hypothetical protein A3F31_00095 [Candidatus Levybacteria bacterium RIFCSPHIGHO2_12_FULL_38_12]OGH34587.1 MAG: hypothetical protein A3A47_01495 [Candidatus Levybacteria bacterium RIFCSPLOWO2_01_FULL_37_20]OGH43439.1 MAG: hypothetical protein A3J14_04550 [Candidatus Levybacteria bacterium RIFCSPLOWO2_02_FULL_37_18]OGH51196.1 MAG: hypothetical protein A3G13_02800 [Candidatus Levybacteria bacterium RIFCSPLOWO2_12_FULL_37_7]
MIARELQSEIDQLGSLKDIVVAYEEIAASYMRRIRNNVVQKRDFLQGLITIFQQVKGSYKKEVEELMQLKTKNKKPSPVIANEVKQSQRKNGKTVLVLISANTGLYGSIVKQTYQLFLEEAKKETSDIVIIGRLGNSLFKNEKVKTAVQYFDFPDNTVDPEALQKIVEYLLVYDKIIAYYGQFQNVVSQKAVATGISGDVPEQDENQPVVKYLFEPSLETILNFFENEIIASIFEQTVSESQLAKFASRMITLDSASENIQTNIKRTSFLQQKLKHRLLNTKQLNTLSGMSLWRR